MGCEVLKKQLDDGGIRYTYASITDNLSNLKVFLKYRESLTMFDQVKAEGRIGIPFIVVNKGEQFFFGPEDLNLDDLK
ncbi:MAG: glutaredoxin [Clostridiaceae bacterium]